MVLDCELDIEEVESSLSLFDDDLSAKMFLTILPVLLDLTWSFSSSATLGLDAETGLTF